MNKSTLLLCAKTMLASALLAGLSSVQAAGLVDIGNSPVVATSAANAKPNIMLLMDASDSMGYTHMPDEVDTVAGRLSVGYKSPQCNTLYFDPTPDKYTIPKDHLGAFFPTPSFTDAPFNGFGMKISPVDLSTRNLASNFQAYDRRSLLVGGYEDGPQEAYYWLHSGGRSLDYAGSVCSQLEPVGSDDANGRYSFPAADGGTWTRHRVRDTAQRAQFAIWYSYYRKRIYLIKSAASLAFVPLTDTYRVGFITVQPKDRASDARVNLQKFLALNDFNAVQKEAWFNKLFAQTPSGASPAREGLARVGRYYAGKFDHMNAGMFDMTTGSPREVDPVEYSCQQNFTILTTDGYWNTQTESTVNGGPRQLDGTTLVGQQDGDTACPASNPWCARPIYDGNGSSRRIDKTAEVIYDQFSCGITSQRKSIYESMMARTFYALDLEKTRRRTQTWRLTADQDVRSTWQTTRTQERRLQATEQFRVRREYIPTTERFRVERSRFEHTKTMQQVVKTASQDAVRVWQVRRLENQYYQTQTQYKRERVQWREVREQQWKERRRFVEEQQQQNVVRYRLVGKPSSEEYYQEIDQRTCPTGWTCRVEERTSTPVAYGACPAPGQSMSPPYWINDCESGSATRGPQNVASCTLGTGTRDAGGPGHVRYICNDVSVDAPAAVAFGSCNANSIDGSNVRTICTTPANGNNGTFVGVAASCTDAPGTNSPFVKKTCTKSIDETTYPDNACSSSTENPFITITCSTVVNTSGYYAGQCATTGLTVGANNLRTNCTNTKSTNTIVDPPSSCPATSSTATVTTQTDGNGPYARSCARVYSRGSDATPEPVDTCTGSTVGPTKTECALPAENNYDTRPVEWGTCADNPGTSSPFITVSCTYPPGYNRSVPAAPSGANACVTTGGASPDWVKVSCPARTLVSGPTRVAPNDCTNGFEPNSPYTQTECTRYDLPAPPPAACVPGNSGPPDHIQTNCPVLVDDYAVPTCSPGWSGPSNDRRLCYKNDTPYAGVEACTEDRSPTGPDYRYVYCRNDTTLPGPAPASAATCPAGVDPAAPGNSYVKTTCSRVRQSADTPVALGTCVRSYGSSSTWIETDCGKGPFYDPVGRETTCTTPQPPATGPDHVQRTCTYSDVTDYTVGTGFSGACARSSADGRIVDCTVEPQGAGQLGALSCTDSIVDGAATQPVTARCGARTDIPAVSSPPCSSGTVANEYRTCSEVLRTTSIETSCRAGQDGAFRTACDPVASAGFILRNRTVATTTTTRVSGTAELGDGVASTEDGTWTNLTACLPTTDPAVALPSPARRLATVAEVALPPAADQRDPPEDNYFHCPAGKWPCSKFVPGPGGSENSLADVASYYYKTDLRTGAAWDNDVPAVGSPPEGDSAIHQHMTTFVVGMGVSGTLAYNANYKSTSNTLGDFPKIRCKPPAVATEGRGCVDWPVWPDPRITYTSTDDYNHPKSIDDFWHTAVNGRGTFFSAKDPDSLVSGLSEALNTISDLPASGAGDAVSSFEPTVGNNFVFSTSYKSGNQRTGGGWTGDLKKYTIRLDTGAIDTQQWSAADEMVSATKAACDNRRIYLARPGGEIDGISPPENAVPFTANTFACDPMTGLPTGSADSSLNGTELDFFGRTSETAISQISQWATMSAAQKTAARGANLVNFLRGQTGMDGYVAGNTSKLFRARSHVLGDFVNSQPVYVGAPFARYQDAGYAEFIRDNRTRESMVYVGGNGGMLHAFSAATGAEKWALIPRTVLPNLFWLADFRYHSGHRWYVDGSPVVGDVKEGSVWKSILVVGLNGGGKGYMAVDVTDPRKPPTVLWEFAFDGATCPTGTLAGDGAEGYKADCNLGFTFGRPVITKLGGEWVVLLTSGYNNRNSVANDGKGFLYVLRASDGVMLRKISTGRGNSTTPSGLAQINNFVENTFVDNTTVRAYGGDLDGNIFRFEFGASPRAQLLGTAMKGGRAQPITTRPEIAELDAKPIIFVGTGKLIGPSDVSGPQYTQSIYGIVDPLTSPTVVYDPLRSALDPLTMRQSGTGTSARRTVTCDDAAACAARTGGWVVDLPEDGERVNVNMQLDAGTLIVGSNVPEAASCSVGGHGWFNFLNYGTGMVAEGRPLVNSGDPSQGRLASAYVGGAMIAGYNLLRLPDHRRSISVTQTNTTHTEVQPPPPVTPPSGKRISWREIAR